MNDDAPARPERPRAPAAPGPARRRVLHHPLGPAPGHPGAGRRGHDVGGPLPLADAGGQRRRRRRGRHAGVGGHRRPAPPGRRPDRRRGCGDHARPGRERHAGRVGLRAGPLRVRAGRAGGRGAGALPTFSAPSAFPVPSSPSPSLPIASGTPTPPGRRPLRRSRGPSRRFRSTSSVRWATRAAACATGCSASSSAPPCPGTPRPRRRPRSRSRPPLESRTGGGASPYLRPWAGTTVEHVTLSDQLVTIGLSGGGAAGVPAEQSRLAVQQLVWTATAAVGSAGLPVRFEVADGVDRPVRHLPDRLDLLPSGRGRDLPGPGPDLGGGPAPPGRPSPPTGRSWPAAPRRSSRRTCSGG